MFIIGIESEKTASKTSSSLTLTPILSINPNKNYNSHTSGFQRSCNLGLKVWPINHSFMFSSAFCLEYFTILLIQLLLMLFLLLRSSAVKPFLPKLSLRTSRINKHPQRAHTVFGSVVQCCMAQSYITFVVLSVVFIYKTKRSLL